MSLADGSAWEKEFGSRFEGSRKPSNVDIPYFNPYDLTQKKQSPYDKSPIMVNGQSVNIGGGKYIDGKWVGPGPQPFTLKAFNDGDIAILQSDGTQVVRIEAITDQTLGMMEKDKMYLVFFAGIRKPFVMESPEMHTRLIMKEVKPISYTGYFNMYKDGPGDVFHKSHREALDASSSTTIGKPVRIYIQYDPVLDEWKGAVGI